VVSNNPGNLPSATGRRKTGKHRRRMRTAGRAVVRGRAGKAGTGIVFIVYTQKEAGQRHSRREARQQQAGGEGRRQ